MVRKLLVMCCCAVGAAGCFEPDHIQKLHGDVPPDTDEVADTETRGDTAPNGTDSDSDTGWDPLFDTDAWCHPDAQPLDNCADMDSPWQIAVPATDVTEAVTLWAWVHVDTCGNCVAAVAKKWDPADIRPVFLDGDTLVIDGRIGIPSVPSQIDTFDFCEMDNLRVPLSAGSAIGQGTGELAVYGYDCRKTSREIWDSRMPRPAPAYCVESMQIVDVAISSPGPATFQTSTFDDDPVVLPWEQLRIDSSWPILPDWTAITGISEPSDLWMMGMSHMDDGAGGITEFSSHFQDDWDLIRGTTVVFHVSPELVDMSGAPVTTEDIRVDIADIGPAVVQQEFSDLSAVATWGNVSVNVDDDCAATGCFLLLADTCDETVGVAGQLDIEGAQQIVFQLIDPVPSSSSLFAVRLVARWLAQPVISEDSPAGQLVFELPDTVGDDPIGFELVLKSDCGATPLSLRVDSAVAR